MFSLLCSPSQLSRRQPPARIITTTIITITTDEIGPLTGAFFLSRRRPPPRGFSLSHCSSHARNPQLVRRQKPAAPGYSTDPTVAWGPGSRSSDARSLERLAEEFRFLQAVAPRQIRGLGDADE